MSLTAASRLARSVLALAAAVACASASAQNMTVSLTPSTAPIANAVTQGVASSLFVDVTNTMTGTTMNEVAFQTPYPATGGAGPAGWALQAVYPNNPGSIVAFQVTTCGQGGLANGQTGTFRIDMTPPGSNRDRNDTLSATVYQDPCGGAVNWTAVSRTYQRKALSMTASATPLVGPAPLTTSVTFTVTNRSSATQNGVALGGVTITPSAGTSSSCAPASFSLTTGASNTFTCSVTLPTAGTSYAVAATAAAASGNATAVGATAGPILVGSATATFAFDRLVVRSGDVVRATLTVTNQSGFAIDVTPPTYAQLTLTPTLAKAPGAADPAPALGVAAGQSASFVYAFTATGAVGATYAATGSASTTAGSTPPATTPSGTLSAWQVTWAPGFVVRSRTTAPYGFSVTVKNGAQDAITRVNVVNPNPGWTNLLHGAVTGSGGSNLAYGSGDGTGTLVYNTGTIPQNGSAKLAFTFAAAPADAQTTPYTFQVVVTNTWAATATYTFTVLNEVPIPDVSSVSVRSTSSGQTLYWANTSGAGAAHDGVVVLRAAAPAVPPFPVDGVDYAGSTTVAYADEFGSVVTSIADPTPGAYNYRICNHDAALVYSGCKTGFWNGAGWIDSAAAPAGGWTHSVGLPALLRPGLVPGGNVGVASNVPAVQLLAVATGARTLGPKALAALPAVGTPVLPLSNGRQILFAADSAGAVTAVDLQSGAIYWQVTKAGESFVAGVAGVLRQYAGAAFQALYANDVLFLASTTGNLLALDATTGATLWTAAAGTALRALPLYDYSKNWVFVPTFAGGILAYDLSSAAPPTAPSAAAGWTNPGGSYTLGCTFGDVATQTTCVDRTGNIRVLDRSTGAVVATGTFTGTGTPSSVWKVGGGLVVGSASAVQAFTVSGATFTSNGTYSPGVTLSPVQVFQSPAPGAIYVGGSDLKVHKLRLDTLAHVGSVSVSSQLAGALLGPPVYDVNLDLFVFGASDGRIWAVPAF